MTQLHIPLRSACAQRNIRRTELGRVELGIHVFPYTQTPFPHYYARLQGAKGVGLAREILLRIFGNEKQVKQV